VFSTTASMVPEEASSGRVCYNKAASAKRGEVRRQQRAMMHSTAKNDTWRIVNGCDVSLGEISQRSSGNKDLIFG